MVDMNGKELKIGDKVRPDGPGMILLIVSEFDVEELGHCLFGQQIENPLVFSPLTKEDLATGWILIEE